MFGLLIHLTFATLITYTTVKGSVPHPWTKLSSQPSHPQEPLTFYLIVKQDQAALQEIESIFSKVTDPDSAEHQKWLKRSEINAILKPNSETLAATKRWIEKQAFTSAQLIGNDAFEITTTVEQASKSFSTQFQPYAHSKSGKIIHRTSEEIRLPDEISSHVDFLLGLSDFILIEQNPHKSHEAQKFTEAAEFIVEKVAAATQIVGVLIPQFVIDYYNIPNVLKTGLPSPVSQGSLQFLGQYYRRRDLRQYLQSLDIPFNPIKRHHLRGINNQSDPGGEAMLDVQQMTGINPLAKTWYFNYNTKNMSGENFYTTALRLNQLDNLPQVMSISYGDPETGLCTYVTDCDEKKVNTARKYIKRTDVEFLKLAIRGITVLAASGDNGANGYPPNYETANCTNKIFYPSYPATSAFVTSVGGTELVNITYGALRNQPPLCLSLSASYKCASGGQEVAVGKYYVGGGGFSRFIPQPSYQKHAVNHYFRNSRCNDSKDVNHCPLSSMYNRQGRAFPDVSAFGADGYTVVSGTESLTGGTSMSTPLWAGVVSILNSYSINLTGRTLGFLNPLLYKMAKECPECFNDITSGNNICPKNDCFDRCRGFETAYGWDPVTGLGSPNVGKMLEYIRKLLKKKHQ